MQDLNNISRPNATAQASPTLLTSLIHRLEAATSRLEDIASSAQTLGEEQGAAPQANGASTTAASTTNAPPAAAVTGAAGTPKAASSAAPAEPEIPQSIQDFDALIKGELKQFTDLSEQIGGIVAEQVRRTSLPSHIHANAVLHSLQRSRARSKSKEHGFSCPRRRKNRARKRSISPWQICRPRWRRRKRSDIRIEMHHYGISSLWCQTVLVR